MYEHFFNWNYIYISIQTITSVLCWSTFGRDYTLEFCWVWHYKLGTPVFGGFLPFFSADPQAQSGWMGSVATQLFSGLSRDVWSGSSPGSGWATVPKPLLRCLGCVLRVVVLLEGKPSPHSEVLSTLEQIFIKDTLRRSSLSRSWLVSQSLPLKNIWMVPGFLQTWRFSFRPKSSILVSD